MNITKIKSKGANSMYQVILTYGENEPWWFFEDWQEDIIEEKKFEDFSSAKTYFEEVMSTLKQQYAKERMKPPLLAAFWNEGETVYCEDCDEDLQAYKGLMLLKDYQKLDNGELKKDETADYSGKTKCCARHS